MAHRILSTHQAERQLYVLLSIAILTITQKSANLIREAAKTIQALAIVLLIGKKLQAQHTMPRQHSCSAHSLMVSVKQTTV